MNGHSYGVMLEKSKGSWKWIASGPCVTDVTAMALRWATKEDAEDAGKFMSRRSGCPYKVAKLNGRD